MTIVLAVETSRKKSAPDEIPLNLRAFVASEGEAEPEPGDERSLTFSLNVPYSLDENGFRYSKSVERQIVRMEQAAEEQEAAEQSLSAMNFRSFAACGLSTDRVGAERVTRRAALRADTNF